MYLEFLCGLCLGRCAVMAMAMLWKLRIARRLNGVIIFLVFFFQICLEWKL
jgi:hypothetical protein